MAVVCSNLYNLSSLKDMKLIAGEKGLSRKVTWFYIGENINVGEWGKGGELMFITGRGMDRSTEGMIELVRICNSYNLAGLVISVNKMYIGSLPQEVIDEADRLEFPVFTIPWEVKRIEVSKEIVTLLMNEQKRENESQILLGYLKRGVLSESEKREMRHIINAYSFGSDISYMSVAVEVDFGNDDELEKKLNFVKRKIEDEFFRDKLITICDRHRVYCLIYGKSTENKHAVMDIFGKICLRLYKQKYVKTAYVGACSDSREENETMSGALCALKIARKIGGNVRTIAYDELGIYRVIYRDTRNSENMEYCKYVIQKLIEYDNTNESGLLDTVIAYFENMYNISKTAEELFIHRNSLMYRLNKIQELTGKNVKNAYEMADIAYCAIAYKIFK